MTWLLLVAAAWLSGAVDEPPEARSGGQAKLRLKVGDAAPDFSLRDMQNNMIRLSEYLPVIRGAKKSKNNKPVLIDFFRTDCEPCKKELPQIVRFHEKYKDEFQVLVVALLEEEGGRDKLEKFFSENKVPFPVLVDAYETVAKNYIAAGESVTLPAIFLIGKSGRVKKAQAGLEKDLEAWLIDAIPPLKSPR